jgi:hypothetical protein
VTSPTGVRVFINEAELAALRGDAWIQEMLAADGRAIAAYARGIAPIGSGRHRRSQPESHGGESIDFELVHDGFEWAAHVSWDAAHWYMIFPSEGTARQPAQRFLETALDRYTRL